MSKLSDAIAAKTANIKLSSEKTAAKAHKPLTGPAIQFDATARMHAAEKKVEDLTQQLNNTIGSSGQLEIPVSQLHEIPGRKRNLDDENYEILKNNLAANDLITPIIVRKREAGGYEIISGHNRANVFRELGRESIPAVIADISDKDADKDAFFANLIHSSLPDYEKYLGFEKLLSEQPSLTHEALAASIGVPRTTLTTLLSFKRLPSAAHKILKAKPGAIGYNTANDLVRESESGHSDLVVKAIDLIVNKQLDQTKAKDWIKKELQAARQDNPTKAAAKPIIIKKGKSTFCHMRQSNKVIRLEFQSVEEAEHIQEQIHSFLKSLAKEGV